MKFARTNQGTCINQRPIVSKGDGVKKGQVLVDSFSLDDGQPCFGTKYHLCFYELGRI